METIDRKIKCTVCGLPCDEHRNDERHAPQPSWVDVSKRIAELEAKLARVKGAVDSYDNEYGWMQLVDDVRSALLDKES